VRGQVAVLVLAVAGAVALGVYVHPVLALVPLVVPGLPAALMLGATIRHGDPYDVRYRYPPGAYLGRSVSTDD
jgi:hypothetical protein